MPKSSFKTDVAALEPHLRNFARRFTKSKETAEDLAQETVCKAYEKESQFTPGTNLKAWLFTILRNLYFSQRRREWRKAEMPDGYENMRISSNAEAFEIVAARQELGFLGDLSDDQREALLMVAGGASYGAVAAVQRVPVGTIKSRVGRGRAALSALCAGTASM